VEITAELREGLEIAGLRQSLEALRGAWRWSFKRFAVDQRSDRCGGAESACIGIGPVLVRPGL